MMGAARKSRHPFSDWLHGRVLYPLVLRGIGEGSLRARVRELETLQYASREYLREYQAQKLSGMLAWASRESPFYKRLWGREFVPPDPNSAHAVLSGLPLVTKSHVQNHASEMRAESYRGRVSHKTTGGSTGQAVTVVKDRTATAAERAAMWLAYGWFGVQPGDRVARFWGAPFATRRRMVTQGADWVMNRIRFSAFAFTDTDLASYWKECLKFSPRYLHGYVSMLEAFARFLKREGEDGTRLGLKSIIATSESLSAPQRALLEEVFDTSVQIEYGCGELGPIAYDCERATLHVLDADVVVELLDPQGNPANPGTAGEVVITDLHNRAMPLIRYRLGDFAVRGTGCKCGRGFETFEKVWGRAYDFVLGLDGRRYHGEFFMYLFEDLRRSGHGVDQFQITQTSDHHLDVAIRGNALTDRVKERLTSLFASRLPGFELSIYTVDQIERTASGKLQVIRNHWQPSRASVSGS